MGKIIGIDLGTTNSAICSFDGERIQLYKSPEQHDVTPSAIYFDKRGNKYVGARAYNNASRNPDNSALLFKRPTKAIEDAVAGGRATMMTLPGATPIEGGVPIVWQGEVVGAVGVSGVQSHEDAQIARAGAEAVGKA